MTFETKLRNKTTSHTVWVDNKVISQIDDVIKLSDVLEITSGYKEDIISAYRKTLITLLEQKPPCSHPGCYNHITHPCEGCGRMQGRMTTDTLLKILNITQD